MEAILLATGLIYLQSQKQTGTGKRGRPRKFRKKRQQRRTKKTPKKKKIRMKKQIKFNKAQEQKAALAYEYVRKKIENKKVVVPDISTNGKYFLGKARDAAKKGQYVDATLYSVMALSILLTLTGDPEINTAVKFDMLPLGPWLGNPNVKLRWHSIKTQKERKLNRAERRVLAKIDSSIGI